MLIGLHSSDGAGDGDPLWLIAPSPLDLPVLQGPLVKERREDLQILSFISMLTATNGACHPVELAKGGDPPDRIVTACGGRYGVELTELTAADTRREVAEARRLGRELQEELERSDSNFPHLKGRMVVLSVVQQRALNPDERRAAVGTLRAALSADRGYVGEGVDVSDGFPEHWPNANGFYGEHAGAVVQVYPNGVPGKTFVTSSCQAEVKLSEVLATLAARVQAKDREGNDVLLMTCGMPDERGYACPADRFIFPFLREHLARVQLSPIHLKAIILHLWNSAEWLELFRRDEEIKWPPVRT